MNAHRPDVPKFDPMRYPRTYAVSQGMRRLLIPMGLLFLTLGLIGVIYLGVLSNDSLSSRAISGALCSLFAILGFYLALGARRYSVTLGPDRVEIFEVLRHRVIERENILGRRHVVIRTGAARWILIPKQGFGRKLELSMFLKTDKDFAAWIVSLPDLDSDKNGATERDVAAAISALADRGYGKHAQTRLRQLAIWLNRGVYGLAIAIYLIPDSHNVMIWIAIALPWIAVILVTRFKPFYRFGGPKNSPLPDLSLPLFIPGLLLTLAASVSISTVDWYAPLALSLLGALILTGVATVVDPWLRKHRVTAILMILLCCGYGYGAGLEINALLDHSTPTSYPVTVLSKRESHGKSTTYYVGIPAWGPRLTGEEVMISGSSYGKMRVGDTVCISLRHGALKIPWYVLTACDQEHGVNSLGSSKGRPELDMRAVR